MAEEKKPLMVAVGSDHAGYELKEHLKEILSGLGHDVLDLGTDSTASCDYTDFAVAVSERVISGEADRGLLICGSGVGMSIASNKFPGIRAALCNDKYTAEYSRRHNDANVITMGARILSREVAAGLLTIFLDTEFEGEGPAGSRHRQRLNKIVQVERKYMKERYFE